MIYEAGALRAVYRAIVADERDAAGACRSAQPATTRRATGASSGQSILWTCADLPGVRPDGTPASSHRRDGLRVCSLKSRLQEARRRDNVAKQRRSHQYASGSGSCAPQTQRPSVRS